MFWDMLYSIFYMNQVAASSVGVVDRNHLKVTKFYLLHASGINTPVGISDRLTQGFPSVRLPT
jgi:hypothetical protein